MARNKRYGQISGPDLDKIERQVGLLQGQMRGTMVSLTPFSPHYDAITELGRAMTKALNLLNDRPADYEKPHRSLMS